MGIIGTLTRDHEDEDVGVVAGVQAGHTRHLRQWAPGARQHLQPEYSEM